MFYLNYVGCKAETLEDSISNLLNSFTLTMWDVKQTALMIGAGSLVGFTLTMWDVKYKWQGKLIFPVGVLP